MKTLFIGRKKARNSFSVFEFYRVDGNYVVRKSGRGYAFLESAVRVLQDKGREGYITKAGDSKPVARFINKQIFYAD